jgi:hypothetical protein
MATGWLHLVNRLGADALNAIAVTTIEQEIRQFVEWLKDGMNR